MDLWPHQVAAAEWLCRNDGHGLLGMEMRTGKTLAALTAMEKLAPNVTWIVAPLQTKKMWAHVINEYTSYKPLPLCDGSVPARAERASKFIAAMAAAKRPCCVIINYEALPRDALSKIMMRNCDCLILDECHRIKAPGGKRSRFIARLAQKVSYVFGLTGTPMPHSPMDIYAQARAINPSVFGFSAAAFRARYAIMGGYDNRQIVGWHHEAEMREKLAALMFQVKYEDVMPPLTETIDYLTCTLSPAARSVYKRLERDFYAEVEAGEITVSNALVKLLRLQQITSGFITVDDSTEIERLGDSKEKLLRETIEDIGPHPIVVYCRFTEDLAAVARCARALDKNYGEISGRFKSITDSGTMPSDIDILGVQIQAGGEGLDLSRSHYSIFYSTGFSLGDYEQARFRQRGVNQTKPLARIHLVAENTVDGKVFRALREKKRVVNYILGGFNGKEEESYGDFREAHESQAQVGGTAQG